MVNGHPKPFNEMFPDSPITIEDYQRFMRDKRNRQLNKSSLSSCVPVSSSFVKAWVCTDCGTQYSYLDGNAPTGCACLPLPCRGCGAVDRANCICSLENSPL